jgi:uncharacterized OsmC-like protein
MIVRAKHRSGFQFELASAENEILSDQWEDYGGEGAGPMPSELFLWSVGACFGQSMVYVAGKMRRVLPGLRLEVDGVKAKEVFRYGSITVRAMADCEPELLAKVVSLAKKYCFVTNSLSESVTLTFVTGEKP